MSFEWCKNPQRRVYAEQDLRRPDGKHHIIRRENRKDWINRKVAGNVYEIKGILTFFFHN